MNEGVKGKSGSKLVECYRFKLSIQRFRTALQPIVFEGEASHTASFLERVRPLFPLKMPPDHSPNVVVQTRVVIPLHQRSPRIEQLENVEAGGRTPPDQAPEIRIHLIVSDLTVEPDVEHDGSDDGERHLGRQFLHKAGVLQRRVAFELLLEHHGFVDHHLNVRHELARCKSCVVYGANALPLLALQVPQSRAAENMLGEIRESRRLLETDFVEAGHVDDDLWLRDDDDRVAERPRVHEPDTVEAHTSHQQGYSRMWVCVRWNYVFQAGESADRPPERVMRAWLLSSTRKTRTEEFHSAFLNLPCLRTSSSPCAIGSRYWQPLSLQPMHRYRIDLFQAASTPPWRRRVGPDRIEIKEALWPSVERSLSSDGMRNNLT